MKFKIQYKQFFINKNTFFTDLNQDATARQESQSQLFHDFLLRANRYNQLDVISNEKSESDFCRSERKIILVEVRKHIAFLKV